ncbi:MAG: GAF domain-containing protein [Aggregatilineales bacterium]
MNNINKSRLDTYSQLKFQFIQVLLVVMILPLALSVVAIVMNAQSIWDVVDVDFLLAVAMIAVFAGALLHLRQYPENVNLVTIIVVLLICGFGFTLQSSFLMIGWSILLIFVATMFLPLYILIPVVIFVSYELYTLIPLIRLSAGEFFTLLTANMIVLAHVLLSVSVRYFNNIFRTSIYNATRAQELLQAASEIGQITIQLLSVEDVFNRSVDLIRDRFAYYHVQIFLVDEDREYADLVASTGSAGRELLARKHRLPVGSRSVIGRVTLSGEVVIARENEGDRKSIHARNELLPNTRAELALPIFDGDTIIGALDVQSTQLDAFNESEVKTLQVMANQLGVSIRNARLFEAQDMNIQENKRLFFESESNLREIQRLNQQLSRDAWVDYLQDQSVVDGIAFDGNVITTDAAWTTAMLDAIERHDGILGSDGHTLAVPISLGGEVLGAIEVKLGDDGFARHDMLEMLQTISSRLAVSLDNARLFEETQLSTYQEQRINEVVGQFESAGTVTDLLQITLKELSQTLGAEHGAIRLSAPKSETEPERPSSLNGTVNGNGQHSDGYTLNGGASS